MEIADEVERLKKRFRELSEESQEEIPGTRELAAGLEKIVAHIDDSGIDDEARFAMVLGGLSSLLEFVAPDGGAGGGSTTENGDSQAPEGLQQFVETFRNEAGKRIQGLSISLMGIFGDVGSDEALEQSTDHLHAIRGGAAMLGLEDVAALAAEMENTLVTGRKVDPAEREWPTQTLLRGFALLDVAVESDPLAIDDEDLDDIIDELRHAATQVDPSVPPPPPPAPPADTTGDSENENGSEGVGDTDGPTDDDSRETKAAPGADEAATNLEQPILIVDDVDTIAASVGFILSELEVPIEVASNGEQAMQMLQENPFSLVISDVDMPRMDGIALTRMIRSTEELNQLPVILLTSLDHPEERQSGMEAGATDYIIKGAIGGGELLRRVQDLLEVAPVVERAKRRKTRRILVAEDAETVAASIAFVLSEGPFEITLAANGKEALRKLKKDTFDLLITDMQMPYMSGIELVTELRSNRELPRLPIVMLTSVDDQEAIANAADAGVDRYLLKGEVAGGKLLSIVEELLAKGN